MTHLKIDKTERHIFEKMCAIHDIGVMFYTMEENELMLLAEIDTDSPGVAFHLGRVIEIELQVAAYNNKR